MLVDRLGSQARERWKTELQERFVAGRTAHIIAVLVVYGLVPIVLGEFPDALTVVRNIIQAYLILVGTRVIAALLNAGSDVIDDDKMPTRVPLRFATQALQTVVQWPDARLTATKSP